MRNGWALLGCAALVALAYFRTVSGGFLSDDATIGLVIPDGSSIDWPHVARTFAGDWRDFSTVEVRYFRPLIVVSYVLDSSVFGLESWGFHLTNLMVHALNGFLVHRLALRLGASGLAAAFAAGAFVLLPWHSEAVVWISGRCDLIYAAGALAALVAHLGFRQEGRYGLLGLTGLSYLVALLAKDSAIAVPLMLVALDAVRPGYAAQKSALRWASPWLVIAPITALYLFWRAHALGDIFSGRRQEFSAWSKATWDDWVRTFELFALPFNRIQAEAASTPFVIAGFAALLLVVSAAIVRARAGGVPWRSVLACCGCFVGSVALFAAAVSLTLDLRGGRLLYLPSVFLTVAIALCVAGGRDRAAGRRPARVGPGLRPVRAMNWLSVAAASGLIGHHFAVLAYNQTPWIEAGKAIVLLQDTYAKTFGRYEGELIEGLPDQDRGAYLALYNSTIFGPPFVTEAPRPDQRARLRMVYDAKARVGRVLEDSAFGAAQKFERDQARGVWLWDVEGAPLDAAQLSNCRPSPAAVGAGFVAANGDPWLVLPPSRALSAPESAGAAETAYLWISPKPPQAPELFWTNSARQNFNGRRLLSLRPELYVTPRGVEQRQVDGFFLYAARLDEHPKWPGIHRVHAVRLDPTDSAGPFSIKYFNIARELRAVR